MPTTDAKSAQVIFCNTVEVHGTLNGVCNVLLGVAHFVPDSDGKVTVEKSFVADLRFDLYCAQQMHDALSKLLADQVKPAPTKSEVN
jgi:hypothetical protein